MNRARATPSLPGLGLLLLSLATPVVADTVHEVRRGETLWGIARAHGVSVEAVREANELDDADRLLAGRRLRIPTTTSAAATGEARRPRDPVGSSPARVVAAAAGAPAPAASPARSSAGEGDAPLAEVVLEDLSGRALDRWFERLGRVERGTPGAVVRVAHFGDSHSATTSFTSAIHGTLAARFGDAGPGFLQPGRPWRSYDPAGVDVGADDAWTFDRVHGRDETVLDDGRFGLGGWSARSAEPDAVLWVETEPRAVAGAFEVQYLAQPGGGSAELLLDGEVVGRIDTAADTPAVGRHRVQTEEDRHRFEVRLRGDGEVRLLGLSAERSGPGVRWDVLATNGARADWLLEWDAGLFAEALAQREPDLVVLLYGTNEAADDDLDLDRYAGRLAEALERVRNAAPEASCLVVGPPDLSHRERRAWRGTPERLPELIERQRARAAEAGCAFLDLFAAMGGPGAMDRWVAADPPLGARDRVHLTARGYRVLGEALAGALLRAYDASTGAASPAAAAE
ncbi:MAG: LysM peptidoglycan-binding domain-containing protein [Deltaproteobacteria bacterium]|nr:LysM peptidoglycan-binding domain-containing protein [Deltaproteobacteria bacterium]